MAKVRWGYAYLFVLALTAALALVARGPKQVVPLPERLEPAPGLAVPEASGVKIGDPISVEDVTLFPVFSDVQQDPGPITTLPAALAAGVAEVREQGAHSEATRLSGRDRGLPFRSRHGDGAVVNSLVIENRGDVPIYVLAGTVVKGGRQDRQIGQDFVVGARSTVPVDAFCVEQGRWNEDREGANTAGKFAASDQLATSSVRVAGQYASNQSEVWAEVSKVNQANDKRAGSGTLMASLDDADIKAKRAALAARIKERLDALVPQGSVVGIAHALGGNVRGVRWFASHGLFAQFRDTLVNTAAADAITARAGAAPKIATPVKAEDVRRFIAEVDREKAEDRATEAGNVNSYRKAKTGFGSTTKYKPPAAAKPMPLSSDYAAK